LLDANGKKTRFMTKAVFELGLKNVEIVQARVESFQPESGFSSILSRAFSSLSDFVNLTRHLLAEKGSWVAMKGRLTQPELDCLDSNYRIRAIPIKVPGEKAERHAILIDHLNAATEKPAK
jgi:16S rRNA (guanine527-N7)-methyltransferase